MDHFPRGALPPAAALAASRVEGLYEQTDARRARPATPLRARQAGRRRAGAGLSSSRAVSESRVSVSRNSSASSAVGRAISVLATYNHPSLVRGERGVLLIIAPDQRQADIVLDLRRGKLSGLADSQAVSGDRRPVPRKISGTLREPCQKKFK